VASIDYRLTDVAPFPAQIHDCKAAIRFLRAHAKEYSIDPSRVGVWGASAGGHLVALLGTSGGVKKLDGDFCNTKQSSRVQAVCDFFGPTDLTAWNSKLPDKLQQALDAFLGGPAKDKAGVARAASPTTYINRGDAPTLIVHGDEDPLVPISQSELFYQDLKKAGVDATYVRVKGAGHGFPASGAEPGRDEIMSTVRQFFDRWLKGK
jgi:acetyl esterase/lipase